MILFLLLVIVALVLALLGVLVKGLFYLLIIGLVIFVLDLLAVGLRLRRRPPKRSPR